MLALPVTTRLPRSPSLLFLLLHCIKSVGCECMQNKRPDSLPPSNGQTQGGEYSLTINVNIYHQLGWWKDEAGNQDSKVYHDFVRRMFSINLP